MEEGYFHVLGFTFLFMLYLLVGSCALTVESETVCFQPNANRQKHFGQTPAKCEGTFTCYGKLQPDTSFTYVKLLDTQELERCFLEPKRKLRKINSTMHSLINARGKSFRVEHSCWILEGRLGIYAGNSAKKPAEVLKSSTHGSVFGEEADVGEIIQFNVICRDAKKRSQPGFVLWSLFIDNKNVSTKLFSTSMFFRNALSENNPTMWNNITSTTDVENRSLRSSPTAAIDESPAILGSIKHSSRSLPSTGHKGSLLEDSVPLSTYQGLKKAIISSGVVIKTTLPAKDRFLSFSSVIDIHAAAVNGRHKQELTTKNIGRKAPVNPFGSAYSHTPASPLVTPKTSESFSKWETPTSMISEGIEPRTIVEVFITASALLLPAGLSFIVGVLTFVANGSAKRDYYRGKLRGVSPTYRSTLTTTWGILLVFLSLFDSGSPSLKPSSIERSLTELNTTTNIISLSALNSSALTLSSLSLTKNMITTTQLTTTSTFGNYRESLPEFQTKLASTSYQGSSNLKTASATSFSGLKSQSPVFLSSSEQGFRLSIPYSTISYSSIASATISVIKVDDSQISLTLTATKFLSTIDMRSLSLGSRYLSKVTSGSVQDGLVERTTSLSSSRVRIETLPSSFLFHDTTSVSSSYFLYHSSSQLPVGTKLESGISSSVGLNKSSHSELVEDMTQSTTLFATSTLKHDKTSHYLKKTVQISTVHNVSTSGVLSSLSDSLMKDKSSTWSSLFHLIVKSTLSSGGVTRATTSLPTLINTIPISESKDPSIEASMSSSPIPSAPLSPVSWSQLSSSASPWFSSMQTLSSLPSPPPSLISQLPLPLSSSLSLSASSLLSISSAAAMSLFSITPPPLSPTSSVSSSIFISSSSHLSSSSLISLPQLTQLSPLPPFSALLSLPSSTLLLSSTLQLSSSSSIQSSLIFPVTLESSSPMQPITSFPAPMILQSSKQSSSVLSATLTSSSPLQPLASTLAPITLSSIAPPLSLITAFLTFSSSPPPFFTLTTALLTFTSLPSRSLSMPSSSPPFAPSLASSSPLIPASLPSPLPSSSPSISPLLSSSLSSRLESPAFSPPPLPSASSSLSLYISTSSASPAHSLLSLLPTPLVSTLKPPSSSSASSSLFSPLQPLLSQTLTPSETSLQSSSSAALSYSLSSALSEAQSSSLSSSSASSSSLPSSLPPSLLAALSSSVSLLLSSSSVSSSSSLPSSLPSPLSATLSRSSPSPLLSSSTSPLLPASSSSSLQQLTSVLAPVTSPPETLSFSSTTSSSPNIVFHSFVSTTSNIFTKLSMTSKTPETMLTVSASMGSPSYNLPMTPSALASSSLPQSVSVLSLSPLTYDVVSSTYIMSTKTTLSTPSSLPSFGSLSSMSTSQVGTNLTSTLMNSTNSSTVSAETPHGSPVTSLIASSSVFIPHPTSIPNEPRIINVTVSLLKEEFHEDLLNESSSRFMNLSEKVNSTLWELFSASLKGLREIKILRFRQGSVEVDFNLLINSSSNATTQGVNKTLLDGNGTNSQGLLFGKLIIKEKCSSGFCLNPGTCQEGAEGALCSCVTGFVGPRCDQAQAAPSDGNYTNWSEFTECSKTCEKGRKSRKRSCINPSPENGGKDCSGLGPDIEYADCNSDVHCPVSPETWIAVGVACGLFFIILIVAVILFLRKRRKQSEHRNGGSVLNEIQANERTTIVPLEVIYEDKTLLASPRTGQTNPEFIGDDDDDDNDIYKAQLLLFLKQSHLIRPDLYSNDNMSDTSDAPATPSRKASAVSTSSGKRNEKEDDAEPLDVDSIQVDDDLSSKDQSLPKGKDTLPTTVL